MRAGILEKLPSTLSRDKKVFVVGNGGMPGLRAIKSEISDLNRDGEWVVLDCRTNVSGQYVSRKFAAVLTMHGVSNSTLLNVRKASNNLDICCPEQALTVEEVRQALRALQSRREGDANSNPSHKFNTIPTEELGENPQTSPPQLEVRATPDSRKLEVVQVSLPAQNANQVDQALQKLTALQSVIDEAQAAVLVISDSLNEATAGRGLLQSQLASSQSEVSRLSLELTAARSETSEKVSRCESLQEENVQLRAEVARLQKALDSLDALIRGVRGN